MGSAQNDVIQAKRELRNEIKKCKAQFFGQKSLEEQQILSESVLAKIEATPEFMDAKVVLAYYSLPDELYTHHFVARWAKSKIVLLPKVVGDDLTLHQYVDEDSMQKGAFGIMEPVTQRFSDYASIDLVVVPGVAFDKNGNRLGRGRGYYDKLFGNLLAADVVKFGVCYSFQMVDEVPADGRDVPMDKVMC